MVGHGCRCRDIVSILLDLLCVVPEHSGPFVITRLSSTGNGSHTLKEVGLKPRISHAAMTICMSGLCASQIKYSSGHSAAQSIVLRNCAVVAPSYAYTTHICPWKSRFHLGDVLFGHRGDPPHLPNLGRITEARLSNEVRWLNKILLSVYVLRI